MKVRRSYIELYYDEVNASKEIQQDLVSFSYTDNAHGVADDVSISLKDEKGIWSDDWFPEEGDKLRPIIHTLNWRHDGDSQSLDCGFFDIDEPECSGPPSVMTINGNSMPTNSSFKDEKKTRSWTNQSFKMIASKISNEAGLDLLYDSQVNPVFSYVLQEESDAAFLLKLCDDHSFGVKISSGQLVIYNLSEYKAKDSVHEYRKRSSTVLSYGFRKQTVGNQFDGVKVKYEDDGMSKWYSYCPKSPDDAKYYTIESVCESYQDAEYMCMSKYAELADTVYVCTFNVTLNLKLISALCIDVSGFGKYDGKYFLDKVTHTVGSGSSTSFEGRMIVSGKKLSIPVTNGPQVKEESMVKLAGLTDGNSLMSM